MWSAPVGQSRLLAVWTVFVSPATSNRIVSPGSATTSERVPAMSTPESNQFPGLSVSSSVCVTGARPWGTPVSLARPLPPLEQEQPEQSERHRGQLADGGISHAVDERSEEAGRSFEPRLALVSVIMVLVSVCAPGRERAVDRLVDADGRDDQHSEDRRDEARANGRAETAAELQSDPGGDERDREREQGVAEHVPEVASGAVVLGGAENDGVVRVLPADHAEYQQRGQEEHLAAGRPRRSKRRVLSGSRISGRGQRSSFGCDVDERRLREDNGEEL